MKKKTEEDAKKVAADAKKIGVKAVEEAKVVSKAQKKLAEK